MMINKRYVEDVHTMMRGGGEGNIMFYAKELGQSRSSGLTVLSSLETNIFQGIKLSLNFPSMIVRGVANILFAIFEPVASLVAVRAVHGTLQ